MPCAQLTSFPFWPQLTEAQRQRAEAQLHEVHFNAGDVVHSLGRDCLGLLLVRRGALRAFLLSEEGREATVAWMRAGEVCVLSAGCVLQALEWDVEIDAEEDSDVVQLPSGALDALMRENPQVESYVYKAAAERFSDVMSAVERLLFSTLEQRVAAYLLDEAARLGAEEIHVTQEQLARHIGSAREAVTRTLKQMAREGLLEVFRGGIRILDRKALYALC